MKTRLAYGVPGVTLAAAGGIWAQIKRVANAPLPHFLDLDPSGRYGHPHGEPLRIGVLGDSTLTGPGLGDRSQVWIARLADRLPWNVELSSHARGGSRVRDVLAEQAQNAVAEKPDLFVVSVGGNDAIHATPARQFARDLGSLVDTLRDTAPVVTLGVGNLSVIPRLPATLRPFVALRSAAIDRAHAAITSGVERVVRVPVGELSDPLFSTRDLKLFADDLFHPGRQIHERWAELFDPFVRDALTFTQRVATASR